MRSFWLGASILCGSNAAYAQRPVVAVFDIEDRSAKISGGALESLVDLIETRLVSSGRYQVVPRAQLKSAMNREKSASFKECYDESCQIEIGKELAAEKTVATRIAKLGKSCLVTIKIYDLRKATAEAGKDEKGACSEEGVYTSLGSALAKLLGNASAAPVASSVAPPRADPSAEARAAEAKGDYALAAQLYERWYRSLPKRDERAARALFLLSRAQYRARDHKAALRNFKSFLRSSKRRTDLYAQQIEGYAWAASYYEAQGKTRNAKSYYLRCVEIVERMGQAELPAPFAGQCAVNGVKLAVGEFTKGKLRARRMKSMSRALKRKANELSKLTAKIDSLIRRIEAPEPRLGLAYQKAQLYDGFAQMVRQIPAPKKFSEEERDIFRTQLDDQAAQIEDKGVKVLKQLLERAKKEQIRNEWTRRASAELNRSP